MPATTWPHRHAARRRRGVAGHVLRRDAPASSASGRRRRPSGCQRIWNGNDTFVCTGASTLRRHLLQVAALVPRLDLDLDRVDDVTVAPAAGRSQVSRRPGAVGARRQQVQHRPPHELLAHRLVGELLEPEPDRDRVARRDDRAAVGARLPGVVRLDPLLAERPLRGDARDRAQPHRRLGARLGRAGRRVLRRLLRRRRSPERRVQRNDRLPYRKPSVPTGCHGGAVQQGPPDAALAPGDAEPPLGPVVRDVQLAEERGVRPVVVARLVGRVLEPVDRVLPPACSPSTS